MRALLLAAGRGSRLGAWTAERPKALVPLAGRPLLDHQREALAAAGIGEVALVRGYRGEELPRELPAFENPRWETTGVVFSLACAEAWLARDDTLVCYTDVVAEARALTLLAAAEDDLAIAYDPGWLALWRRRFAEPLEDAETFLLGSGGRVRAIGGRPRALEEIEGQYMGLVKLTPAGAALLLARWRRLPERERERIDVTGLLGLLVREGAPLGAVRFEGFWCEIDRPGDLALAEELLAGRGRA